MTDYTDPESPVADPHAIPHRLTYERFDDWTWEKRQCMHCGLERREHVGDFLFCPEWRLRQLDGDR